MTTSKKLEPLDLNLAQWQKDIQTFVSATQNELNEITNQLSSAMAGGPGAASFSSSAASELKTPETKPVALSMDSPPTRRSSISTGTNKTDDRIAKLKQQLSARTGK